MFRFNRKRIHRLIVHPIGFANSHFTGSCISREKLVNCRQWLMGTSMGIGMSDYRVRQIICSICLEWERQQKSQLSLKETHQMWALCLQISCLPALWFENSMPQPSCSPLRQWIQMQLQCNSSGDRKQSSLLRASVSGARLGVYVHYFYFNFHNPR